jgi:hypothetical protein
MLLKNVCCTTASRKIEAPYSDSLILHTNYTDKQFGNEPLLNARCGESDERTLSFLILVITEALKPFDDYAASSVSLGLRNARALLLQPTESA